MKNFGKLLFTIVSVTLFSACEIAGEKPSAAPARILGFFEAEESALSPTYLYSDSGVAVRDLFSNYWGTVFLSDENATFAQLAAPEMGCRSTHSDQPAMKSMRFIDVGDLTIAHGSDNLKIAKNATTFNFFNLIFLAPGPYENQISGMQNALGFNQPFNVPTSPRAISVSSGPGYFKQVLPSPTYAADSIIHIKKEEGLQIDFDGRTDAPYVRVVLENLDQSDSSLTCYGLANETLDIPATALASFTNGDHGSLYVDFLSTALKKDIPRIKESFVRSFTRHRHGVQVFRQNSGNIVLNFGVVRFE